MGMKDGIARIGKTIDHAIDKFIGVILETRKGYNQTVFLFNPSGDDSVPCKKDKVIILKVDGNGNFKGIGILTESQGAKPGEKIFFGRDQNGKITSKFSMLNNGDVTFENDSDVTGNTKGNISISNKGDQKFSADKNTDILAKQKLLLKGNDVEANGQVVITGGTLKCKGTAPPSGIGCFCAKPFCILDGSPHIGDMVNGT